MSNNDSHSDFKTRHFSVISMNFKQTAKSGKITQNTKKVQGISDNYYLLFLV